MIQFFASAIVGLGCFAVSFWVSRSRIIALTSRHTGAILLLTSGAALHLIGPNPIAFGLFLGSGWSLLNQLVDEAFSEQGSFSHHQTG